VFGFVSSEWRGLSAACGIDGPDTATPHAAQSYFQQRYGLEIDPAVKDRLRLCFVSLGPRGMDQQRRCTATDAAAAVEAKPTKATRTGTASHVAQDGGSLDFAKLEKR